MLRRMPTWYLPTFFEAWTGQMEPVFDEPYTFSVVSDDGCRLWVGDSLLIDKWQPQAATEHSGTILLESGRQYPIRLEDRRNRRWRLGTTFLEKCPATKRNNSQTPASITRYPAHRFGARRHRHR